MTGHTMTGERQANGWVVTCNDCRFQFVIDSNSGKYTVLTNGDDPLVRHAWSTSEFVAVSAEVEQ